MKAVLPAFSLNLCFAAPASSYQPFHRSPHRTESATTVTDRIGSTAQQPSGDENVSRAGRQVAGLYGSGWSGFYQGSARGT